MSKLGVWQGLLSLLTRWIPALWRPFGLRCQSLTWRMGRFECAWACHWFLSYNRFRTRLINSWQRLIFSWYAAQCLSFWAKRHLSLCALGSLQLLCNAAAANLLPWWSPHKKNSNTSTSKTDTSSLAFAPSSSPLPLSRIHLVCAETSSPTFLLVTGQIYLQTCIDHLWLTFHKVFVSMFPLRIFWASRPY